MANIRLNYTIDNRKELYSPGDIVSGKVWIQNLGTKDEKLKSLEARVIETCEVYQTKSAGKNQTQSGFFPHRSVHCKEQATSKIMPFSPKQAAQPSGELSG